MEAARGTPPPPPPPGPQLKREPEEAAEADQAPEWKRRRLCDELRADLLARPPSERAERALLGLLEAMAPKSKTDK